MRRVLLASLLLGALALAGCATTAGSAPATNQPAPGSATVEVDAAWLDGGRMIALITDGSSSCPPKATNAELQVDGSLAVTLEDPIDAACTRDLAPRASLVALPDDAEPGAAIDIVVTYGVDTTGETALGAYTGAAVGEFMPSATAIGDDLIAVLTWGSSSCVPVVEQATTDAGAVAIAFATPPADQVCTMDMGPRVSLASVSNASAANTVTLSGGAEFATPVEIPLEH